MILKGSGKKKYFKRWMLPTLLVGTLILLFIYKFSSGNYQTAANTEFVKETYTCSAETVDDKSFIENDIIVWQFKSKCYKIAHVTSRHPRIRIRFGSRVHFSIKLAAVRR